MKRNFNDIIRNLKETIADYEYYVNFDKIYKNIMKYQVELNILNSLIGSKHIETDFLNILNSYSNVLLLDYLQPKFAHLGYGERISNYSSFFTTQTNYIVGLYFFLYLFESKFKNTKPHYVIQLAVTTYITITMLVFWVGIVGQKDQAAQYRPYHWVATVILHLVMPVIMITSYVLTAGDHYYHYEEHHKKYLWLIMLYMVAYLTIILIRGTYRHLDGKETLELFFHTFS